MDKILVRSIFLNKKNRQRSITLPSKLFKGSNPKMVRIRIEGWFE